MNIRITRERVEVMPENALEQRFVRMLCADDMDPAWVAASWHGGLVLENGRAGMRGIGFSHDVDNSVGELLVNIAERAAAGQFEEEESDA